MIKKILFSCTIIFCLSFAVFTGFQDLVLEKLDYYTTNFPEKVYIKTDKPYYAIGDDIWYAAYLVNGINHLKSSKSNIIYIELINDKDSIVSQRKLYTDDISVAGDIKIKKEWKSGTYLLRAYTNYMRNSSPDYFFQKNIQIWGLNVNNDFQNGNIELNNSKKEIPSKEEIITKRPDINFYPEGGYLINGIQSKVAIKVKDKKNRNISIEGKIKDSENNIVSTFKTYKFGLSMISFTPESNKIYQASIMLNGKEEKYTLPKALPQGFSLNLQNNGNEIVLKITSNNPIGLKNALLIGHQRGKVIFEKFIETSISTNTIKLNTTKLNSGVTNFTLFNNSGKPVCERLVYIDNPNNNININLNNSKESIKTREKVTLEIDLNDNSGNPVSGNLSLTINDLDAIQKNSNDENIKTYLLLNSDLRGHIENPGYFFEKENSSKRLYLLDLVMLTHGWSRFTWNDVLYNKSIKKDQYQIEKGLYIYGKTQALKEKGKNISATTRLTFMGSSPYQELIQSDLNGDFNFGPYVFYDSVPSLIEARVKHFKSDFDKNRDINILLRNSKYYSPKISHNNVLKSSNINETIFTNFIKQSKNISEIDAEYLKGAQKLDEILITANKKNEEEKREEELTNRTDYGGWPTHRLDLSDMPRASQNQTIFDLLRNLPGVTASTDTVLLRNQVPRIILDGFPVQEIADVSFLRGSDIEFIDVLLGASASFYNNSSSGVIAIYTKLGDSSIKNLKRDPGIIDFYYPGFYTAREFYSPDYSDSFNDATKQDIRNTLHWEPKIILSNNGSKAEVSFYTSNSKSRYAIEIEGITNMGIPVYHFSTLEVE